MTGHTELAELAIPIEEMGWLRALCGPHHAFVQKIESLTETRIDSTDDGFRIQGGQEGVAWAGRAIDDLLVRLKAGHNLAMGDVEGAVRLQGRRPGQRENRPINTEKTISLSLPKRTIVPRSKAQQNYLQDLAEKELVFGVGPAGTGKTYLAVAHGVQMLLDGKVERMVLSRPAVEAGENIGFLPGDMKDKVDPYLQPLYDALYDVMSGEVVDKKIASKEIEIAPLAFMRGRTLSRSVVILDEAQNATAGQMKMFLTRLGEGSRMVVTGDPSQTDLMARDVSGLGDALALVATMDEVGITRFSAKDVVRHQLVAKLVSAYEKRDAQRRQGDKE